MKKGLLIIALLIIGCIAYTVQTNFGWTYAQFLNRQGSSLIWGMDSSNGVYPIKVDSNGSISVNPFGSISGITSENLVLTSISTEYSKSFTSANKITFQNRGSEAIKYAYESGVVATGEAYMTLNAVPHQYRQPLHSILYKSFRHCVHLILRISFSQQYPYQQQRPRHHKTRPLFLGLPFS